MLEIKSCAYPIAISIDSKLFLHGSARSMVSLYAVETRKKLASFKIKPHISRAQFAPDSDRVALMDTSGNIFLINLEGEILLSIKGNDNDATLHFGTLLARVSTEGEIDLFDPHTGSRVRSHRGLKCMRGSAMIGSQLFVAQMRIDEFMIPHFQKYNINTLKAIDAPIELPLGINHLQWGVSASGKVLWTVSYDETYKLTFFDWTGSEMGFIDFGSDSIGFVEFTPNDDEFIVERWDIGLRRFRFPELKAIADLPKFACATYSADGRLLGLGGMKSGILMEVSD